MKLTFLTFESLGGKKILSYVSIFLDLLLLLFKFLFQNKNTMVASKMGLLRRTANWNLWYMNVDLDLDFGCSLLFLFYVYGWEMWHLSNFCVFNRFGYRIAHPRCSGHSTNTNACGVWGTRVGVQVSKREFHTHIHLD